MSRRDAWAAAFLDAAFLTLLQAAQFEGLVRRFGGGRERLQLSQVLSGRDAVD